jgi:hypothetical protein
MFSYILSKDYQEICVLRTNSNSMTKLEEVADVELNTDENGVQELRFNFNALKAFLTANLVGVDRPVVVPPEFKGRSYDSSKPQQRELLGGRYSFYETEEDQLLLMFADIFLELEKFDADDKWLYGFCGKTHKEYREFLQLNKK